MAGRTGRRRPRRWAASAASWSISLPLADQAGDERHTEFLDAAWKLISEQGYHSVRIAGIARACGTSGGAVHYYLLTKQDVLSAALMYCVESAFESRSVEVSKAVDGAYERLLRLIDMQLPTPGRIRDEWLDWLQFWAETTPAPNYA
ncbi:TetR family transcriptional regulator [Streptomyces sp. NPDC058142]|uniref:TetR family transcriptional regulator n=1 Tax=Streptomyces sp. NPDC058142 TaxID=3346355 RepID=UPI0036E1F17F